MRKPDFMVITKDSAVWRPILIEIESPKKRMFRQDGNDQNSIMPEISLHSGVLGFRILRT